MAISLKIDDQLKQQVDALAAARDRSPHWIMREAIKNYVAQEQSREDFKAEALASWQDYKETGLHITGDETLDWLKTWGLEAETAAPECHD